MSPRDKSRRTAGKVPRCAAELGCLCAGHARGASAGAPCSADEGPVAEPQSAAERFAAAVATFDAIPRNPAGLCTCARPVYDAAERELRAAAIAALGWDPEPSGRGHYGRRQSYDAATHEIVTWARKHVQEHGA